MSIRFALAPLLFSLLAACSAAAPDTTASAPATDEPVLVEVEDSPSLSPSMMRACECDLAAGSIVWKCNGQCTRRDMENLPH